MDVITAANLGLRFLLELSALAALAYWGFHTGQGVVMKLLLGIGTPVLAAAIWGTFVSPRAPVTVPGPVHFMLALAVFAAGVLALLAAGRPALSVVMGTAVAVHMTLLLVTSNQ